MCVCGLATYGSLTALLLGRLYLVVLPIGAGAIALVFAGYLGRLVARHCQPAPWRKDLLILAPQQLQPGGGRFDT